VLRDQGAKKQLAFAMGERLRADRARDKDSTAAIEADVARSYERILAAPVAILICFPMEDTHPYQESSRRSAEHQMAVQATGMAMQNIQLAVTAVGLGSSIMCAPLARTRSVTRVVFPRTGNRKRL
jgi:coenzyme F420-0:L-glutamate ligase / coenzyme F420-1:gamma-L-glutamate ligase